MLLLMRRFHIHIHIYSTNAHERWPTSELSGAYPRFFCYKKNDKKAKVKGITRIVSLNMPMQTFLIYLNTYNFLYNCIDTNVIATVKNHIKFDIFSKIVFSTQKFYSRIIFFYSTYIYNPHNRQR